jgi:hypothetical protein
MRHFILVLASLLSGALVMLLVSCSSGSNNSMQTATVRVSLSDPATCSAPQGVFSHIYVTVTDVRIHQSASASDTDSGWVDLAPGLAGSPVQVDLLGAATQCFLKMLGSSELQPGTYQQIRIFLADNGATVRRQPVWERRQLRGASQRSTESTYATTLLRVENRHQDSFRTDRRGQVCSYSGRE